MTASKPKRLQVLVQEASISAVLSRELAKFGSTFATWHNELFNELFAGTGADQLRACCAFLAKCVTDQGIGRLGALKKRCSLSGAKPEFPYMILLNWMPPLVVT